MTRGLAEIPGLDHGDILLAVSVEISEGDTDQLRIRAVYRAAEYLFGKRRLAGVADSVAVLILLVRIRRVGAVVGRTGVRAEHRIAVAIAVRIDASVARVA